MSCSIIAMFRNTLICNQLFREMYYYLQFQDLCLNGSPPDQIRNPSPNNSTASTSFNRNIYKSSQQQQQQQQQQGDQYSSEERGSNRTEEQVIFRTNRDEPDHNESTPFL